jgi:hypothetical protein
MGEESDHYLSGEDLSHRYPPGKVCETPAQQVVSGKGGRPLADTKHSNTDVGPRGGPNPREVTWASW